MARFTPDLVERMSADDVTAALELSMVAGWNQTEDDWRLLLELAPEGCCCIRRDGRAVATASLMRYGTRLAWIGMVLTHPEYRGKGLATSLLTHILAKADAQGVRTVKLDATEYGEPLYRRFGFVGEQPVERWSRRHATGAARAKTCADLTKWKEFDQRAFGADRWQLLSVLRRRGGCFANSRAFLLTRPGRSTSYLGPCIAAERDSAGALLEAALKSAGRWSWDLLPENREASMLASELGFSPARQLVRMTRGEQLRADTARVYAIAGFEFG
jgi:GNAT superfamily N-acetyltransferase